MRQAILIEPGTIRLDEVEIPAVGDGEVLMRVETALTCGTDVKTYRRGHPLIPLPAPLGHEFAGVVVEVGAGVEGLTEGTPIVATPSAPCGECFFCGKGQGNLCERIPGGLLLGGFGEYLCIPAHIVRQNTFPLRNGLSFETAALLDPLASVVHGQALLGIRPGESVAIIGSGPIALMHVHMARLAAANIIIVVGSGERRLEAARRLGATHALDRSEGPTDDDVREPTHGYGPDVVIECAGATEAWEQAGRMVRNGGRVLLFGGCPGGSHATFDTQKLHYGETTLLGSFHYTPADVARAYQILAEGGFPSDVLVEGTIALPEVEAGLQQMMRREVLKLAVRPGPA